MNKITQRLYARYNCKYCVVVALAICTLRKLQGSTFVISMIGAKLIASQTTEQNKSAFFFLNHSVLPSLNETINQFSTCKEVEPGEMVLLAKSNQSRLGWPPKLVQGGNVICKCVDGPALAPHFPHTMQSIYGCWSIWEANPGHPIIVGPPGHKGFIPSSTPSSFVEWMMEAMIGAFNVTVTTMDKFNDTELDLGINPNFKGRPPYFILRADAMKWTDGILRHLKLERRGCEGAVRIGILNRNGSRAILNAQYIQSQMVRIFGDKVEMDTVTFDGLSLREQIAWYSTHSIILTGHGAQETGLPFMPKCGVLLELFPVGYYVPSFFGALSDSCHVRHYTMYATQSPDPVGETKNMSQTFKERVMMRSQNFCPDTGKILVYLLRAIRDFVSCCETGDMEVNSGSDKWTVGRLP